MGFFNYTCFILIVLAFGANIFGVQTVFVNQKHVWTGESSKDWQLTQLEPYNLRSPVDYFGGDVLWRYECLDKPSQEHQVAVQMCIWQNSFDVEGCSYDLRYTQNGVYFFKAQQRSNWFLSLLKGTVDFSVQHQRVGAVHKYQTKNSGTLQPKGAAYTCIGKGNCTEDELRTHYLPINYKISAIMVKPGDTLVPPADWDGCPWPGCSGNSVDVGHGWHRAQPAKQDVRAAYDVLNGRVRIMGTGGESYENMDIVNVRGAQVRTIRVASHGSMDNIYWDCKNNHSMRVSPGIYIIRLTGRVNDVAARIAVLR